MGELNKKNISLNYFEELTKMVEKKLNRKLFKSVSMRFPLGLFLLLLTSSLFSQKVTTTVDTIKNKIGAEFKLTLKATVNKSEKVKFPESKVFGALEVINSYKIDTVKKDNSYELIKKYGLTQFDSGRYVIPRLPILINGQPGFSAEATSLISNIFCFKVSTFTSLTSIFKLSEKTG